MKNHGNPSCHSNCMLNVEAAFIFVCLFVCWLVDKAVTTVTDAVLFRSRMHPPACTLLTKDRPVLMPWHLFCTKRKLQEFLFWQMADQNQSLFQSKAQSTQDTGCHARAQIGTLFLWCCLCAVWTPPFTSTGPICLRRIARGVPRPVWIGPKYSLSLMREWKLLPLSNSMCLIPNKITIALPNSISVWWKKKLSRS